MNTGLFAAQQLPIIVLMIMTFTLIEAAGEAEYKPLKGQFQVKGQFEVKGQLRSKVS